MIRQIGNISYIKTISIQTFAILLAVKEKVHFFGWNYFAFLKKIKSSKSSVLSMPIMH
jgi:hypothetical protein